MNTLVITLISLILFVFSSLPVAQTFSQNSQNFNKAYNTHIVIGRSLDKRALLGGAVVSSAQVSLSGQISGDILSVNGKEGDMFKKGEVLVTLEQESIEAEKNSAQAEIASAAEALKNARVQYEQSIVSPYSDNMFGGAFTMFTDPMNRFTGRGNADFDKYANRTSHYTNFQQAKNKLRQAQFDLKQIEERLEDTAIVAPFDGVIVVKNINKGDVVQPGQVLVEFANINNLQVEVNIPSRLVSSLKLDKKYRIKLDIANIVVSATLSQIYPVADDNKHSVKVKFNLPANVPVLAGAYAEVEIFETDSGVLTPIIPKSAIIWRSSLPSVFIVNPRTKQTELRFVRLGERVGKNEKSVLSGLKIGEQIVSNPDILMTSGMDILPNHGR